MGPQNLVGELFGRHEVTELLGSGGMAQVWAARHVITGHEVVVKLLLPEIASRDDMVQRFLQEARAAASIDDPGVVKVIDYKRHPDGRVYHILERLRGESMGERLKREHRLSVKIALGLMRQLAVTMATAHSQGIVHRDLKPDNLFLVRDPERACGERIKVLDFGLAHLVCGSGEVQARDGVILGTPAYMSPEQTFNAAEIDHRADLYSMGCILYRMLCGETPFGSDIIKAIHAQRHNAPRAPHVMFSEIPFSVSKLVIRLLHKSPDKRVQDCQSLVRIIDDCLNPVAAVVDGDATVPVSGRSLGVALMQAPLARDAAAQGIVMPVRAQSRATFGDAVSSDHSRDDRTGAVVTGRVPSVHRGAEKARHRGAQSDADAGRPERASSEPGTEPYQEVSTPRFHGAMRRATGPGRKWVPYRSLALLLVILGLLILGAVVGSEPESPEQPATGIEEPAAPVTP